MRIGAAGLSGPEALADPVSCRESVRMVQEVCPNIVPFYIDLKSYDRRAAM